MTNLRPRELTPEGIRAFCRDFDEGIRVEYKRDLSGGVRGKLPKVVSSFANSFGGVLIIGVKSKNGKPVEPIEGFAKPGHEEEALTVENICHQNIYPTLIPRVTEVSSDVVGKIFLVVEVEASPEAPHAIENSRKVYVRTGRASDPHDLADIDLIDRLIKRREDVLRHRQQFESEVDEYVVKFFSPTYPHMRLIIGPRFPQRQIINREMLFQFLRDAHYRDGYFYRRDEIRRFPRGVCGTRLEEGSFGYLDTFGHLCHQEKITCLDVDKPSRYEVYDLIRPIVQGIYCCSRLYQKVEFRCDIYIEAQARDMGGHSCIWRPSQFSAEQLVPPTSTIPGELTVASEFLETDMLNIATTLTHQILWPMKRGDQSISEEDVRPMVKRILDSYAR